MRPLVTHKVKSQLKKSGTVVGHAVFDSAERYSGIIDAIEAGKTKVDMWINLVRRESTWS